MMSFVLAATFAGCSDINDQNPAGFVITDEQKSQTVEAIPERVKADLAGMATGNYYSEFWGDDDRTPYQEPATLEYSEMKKTYRFTNILLGQSPFALF